LAAFLRRAGIDGIPVRLPRKADPLQIQEEVESLGLPVRKLAPPNPFSQFDHLKLPR
jgi:hypothetical protein